jgi:hypothetical protein
VEPPRVAARSYDCDRPAKRPATTDGSAIDAFTVQGGALGVYALTPSGGTWVRVQSSQVAIAYGSSG